jgi:error-prone DNA polymerase
MGFYSASQLTQDVRRHGVEVRPVEVNRSEWDSSLECREDGSAAMRLGLRQIKGLSEASAEQIVSARANGRYQSIQQLAERTQLNRRELEALAAAGALAQLDGHRHLARWAVAGVEAPTALFDSMDRFEATPMLRRPTEGQDIVADYKSTGLTLERHPMQLLRQHLDVQSYTISSELRNIATGSRIKVAGLVITKQRPGTASGVTFVTLEDESGCINLIVWKKIADDQRDVLLNSRLMGVDGELQIEGKVVHVIARRLHDHSALLGELEVRSRNFR